MTIKPYSWILLLAFAVLVSSCSPTRKLGENEYLLTKNVIQNDSKVVSKSDLESFLRQKPNRRIFGFYRFHLQVHNLVNREKLEKRVDVLTEKNNKRNARRKLKGKTPKDRRRSFWEWLADIGEEPVIYDALTSQKSAEQLQIYLQGKGHFNAVVTDSVIVNAKRKKAKAVYSINSQRPYNVRKIKYLIDDPRLARLAKPARGREVVLKDGMNYDVEKFQEERERIERNLKSNGYYAFSDDYVRLEVDSNLGTHQVDVTVFIADPQSTDTTNAEEGKHQMYRIRDIYVHTDYDQKNIGKIEYDTLIYNGIHFLYKGKFQHRPEMLLDKIFFKTGDIYRIKRGELTYRYLSSLRAYKFINIAYGEDAESDGSKVLDCYINLTPGLRQAYAIELQGTNTEGNLGISGSFVYKNKNLFRGAEILQFRFTGGLESQVVASNIQDQNINGVLPFNTIELNPEISLDRKSVV